MAPIKTFLLEIFPIPLSQNKDRKAETKSGGPIPPMSSAYFPEADATFSEDSLQSASHKDPVAPNNPEEREELRSAVQGETTHKRYGN